MSKKICLQAGLRVPASYKGGDGALTQVDGRAAYIYPNEPHPVGRGLVGTMDYPW